MTDTDSGWRKRQIALDQKAENARELGLDYEPDKTIIEMAREADIKFKTNVFCSDFCDGVYEDDLEAFAALVRANERSRTWTQENWTEYERSIAAVEREACAKVCDHMASRCNDIRAAALESAAENIRARGNT